jgi:hypothetical protein
MFLIKINLFFKLLFSILIKPTKFNLALKLIPLFSKRQMVFFTFFLVFINIKKINKTKNKTSVLIIEKHIFTDDIEQSLIKHSEVSVYSIPRAILKCIALAHLAKDNCADDTYIFDTQEGILGKKRYRFFFIKVWRLLYKMYAFKAIVTGNWAYWAEREIPYATKTTKTLFIVMHKEGIKPPGRSEFLKKHFFDTRGQFNGDVMMVYQESEKNHQIQGKISKADQIVVCGMPRMDALHAWRINSAVKKNKSFSEKPSILILPILEDNFLPVYSGIDDGKRWTKLSLGILKSAIDFAILRKDVHVLIRPRSYEMLSIQNTLNSFKNIPSNVEVSYKGNIEDKIKNTWCLVGHNSTALLEGLAAGKVVIEPEFYEASLSEYKEFIVDLSGATKIAKSEKELIFLMDKYTKLKPKISLDLDKKVLYNLHKWTGNNDGQSGIRICNEFKKLGIY